MPTPSNYKFTYAEIAKLLAKEAGVKEGFWGIQLTFGLQGTNIGPDDSGLKPAAIVIITEVGLQRFEHPSGLTIDASTLDDD